MGVLAGHHGVALGATLLATAFAIVGIGLTFRPGARHRDVPQGWLFVPVAALGVAGLW